MFILGNRKCDNLNYCISILLICIIYKLKHPPCCLSWQILAFANNLVNKQKCVAKFCFCLWILNLVTNMTVATFLVWIWMRPFCIELCNGFSVNGGNAVFIIQYFCYIDKVLKFWSLFILKLNCEPRIKRKSNSISGSVAEWQSTYVACVGLWV